MIYNYNFLHFSLNSMHLFEQVFFCCCVIVMKAKMIHQQSSGYLLLLWGTHLWNSRIFSIPLSTRLVLLVYHRHALHAASGGITRCWGSCIRKAMKFTLKWFSRVRLLALNLANLQKKKKLWLTRKWTSHITLFSRKHTEQLLEVVH